MTARESEVFLLIRENPMIPQEEIAEKLGITRSAVSVHISSLMKQGMIKGRGYVLNQEEYVVVIGTASMDFVGLVRGRLSDSVSQDIVNDVGDIWVGCGGAAKNIAENLVRLGAHARLMSAISSDMFGRQIVEHCGEIGVNVDDCLRQYECRQSMMIQFRDFRDRNKRVNYGVLNDTPERLMTPGFFQSKYDVLRNAGQIVLTDVVSGDSIDYLLSAHADKRIWGVFSGVKSRLETMRPRVARMDVLYLSKNAAAELAGLPYDAPPETVAESLAGLGVREAYISCDNRAMARLHGGGLELHPLRLEMVSDNEKGKDAFVAGLVFCQGRGYSAAESVRFAEVVSHLLHRSGYRSTRELDYHAVRDAMKRQTQLQTKE